MKAIVQDRYGSPDVLRVADIDRPAPGDGEALVRVHAASVNPGAWHLMAGEPYLMRVMGFGLRAPKVPVSGTDLAGVVEAAGKDVTAVKPGDEVFGSADGTFAEYTCAREDTLAPKPANLTFEEAAAVPDSGCTALRALRDQAELQAGQHALIIGAAGGIGTFAVQIAKALGAEVTGVCSTAKIDLVRSLGADHAIDYTKEDIATGGRRYDVIIDLAGRRSLARLRRALAPEGTLVIVGGEGGGRWFGGMSRNLAALATSPFVRQRLRAPVFTSHPKEALLSLTDLIEAGKVRPVIDRAFPLEQAADAIRLWETGHARGKIVISMTS
jgi:NADPH:quinone reductase-like Zn-dependent oxidoreductase